MTEEVVSTEEGLTEHERYDVTDAPSHATIKAVEIIRARFEVPGSLAYRILVEAATDLRMSVYELVRCIVETPGPLDYLGVTEERSARAAGDDPRGQGLG